ncbi:Thioredoxin O1, mitochondrial [Glycine max]|nr:Thioredoxin O1, mitochondrial [Glycine max]
MARNWVVRSLALRHAMKNRVLTLSFNRILPSLPSKSSLLATTAAATASSQLSLLPSFHHSRSLSSASAPSDVVLVNSEEEFNNILTKMTRCTRSSISLRLGRFISPIVGELSKKYPHVTTYKIDIDQEALQGTLGKLQISSVPTLHFFQNGKKADELIGADVARLNYITEKLFKKD